MRRNRYFTSAALTTVLVCGAAAAFAAMSMSAAEPVHEKHTMVKLKVDGTGSDAIVLEDLHDLEVGESRSFPTESGKIVVATRTEQGLVLDVDGKTITIGGFGELGEAGGDGHTMIWHSEEGDSDLGDGEAFVFRKRIEIADGEAGKTMVWHSESGDGPRRIHVLKTLGEGEEAEGFAFSTGEDFVVAPFSAEGWIERLEQTESFRQLDEATREIVRRAMREAGKQARSGEGVFLIDVEEEEQ